MTQIYTRNSYIIFRAKSGYIVYNTSKDFVEGHTHLFSFDCAKYLINLAINKRIPYNLDTYRLISLIRISDDEIYKAKIQSLVETKKQRKASYNNSRRVCRNA